MNIGQKDLIEVENSEIKEEDLEVQEEILILIRDNLTEDNSLDSLIVIEDNGINHHHHHLVRGMAETIIKVCNIFIVEDMAI